ncbi:MAG: LytR C-terminal domain-containing protein [Actinomycetota bacterium]
MRRRQRLIRRSVFPLVISVLAGLLIGVGVAGLPDPEALDPLTGNPPLTVKPGVLVDPSEFTVPPLLLTPSTIVGSGDSTISTSTTSTTVSDGLRTRNAVLLMVANGNRTPGAAALWGDRLVSLGYGRPVLANTGQVEQWTIYFADGYAGEAQRLAADLQASFLPVSLATIPLSRAPRTDPAFTGQILLVLGLQNLVGSSSTTTSSTAP